MKNIFYNINGFTLVEAVIALGVLSIGILAMFSMQTMGIRGNSSANRITTETTWGADRIEQLIASKYAPIATIPSGLIDNDPNYSIAWTVANNTPLEDMKLITITVTNVADGKSVALRQMKVNEDGF
jgi:Tfp pilus assembly protein PilV